MRRTGKLYTLTLVSMSLGIIASVSVSLWDFNSSELHLWLDLIPHGFGIAGMITSTLIVSPFDIIGSVRFLTLIGHDRKCGEGGYRRRHGDHVPFPDLRSSTRGQLERSTSSGNPHETASEADHGTRGFRGSVHCLSKSNARSADPRTLPLQIIERIRHSTTIIPELPIPLRVAAVTSYADALRAVFICQVACHTIALVCCLPIQENPLPCVFRPRSLI